MSDATRAELVRLLAAAELPARDEDVERLLIIFPAMRQAVQMLHAVPEVGHEPPAVLFAADPEVKR